MGEWVIGIDLGGTKIEVGLVDPQNHIVARKRVATRGDEGPQAVVERIARCVAEVERYLPDGREVKALGICSPGPLDHQTGTLIDPPNIPGLHNTPLGQLLSQRLNLPVSLEHDAKAAALGDFYYGAGRDDQSMVYIVVGTGVGAAIIMDGELIRGTHNYAGEVGHITIDRNGYKCHCGTRGCVETFLSGPSLARRYRQALEREGKPESSPTVTGELVSQWATQGDVQAVEVMRGAGEALGIAVASMAMILDIGHYVIGGSVAKSGDLLLGPARAIVPDYCFQSVGSRVRIDVTALGDDGPILGCAWLARQSRNG
jgi:glucokinase